MKSSAPTKSMRPKPRPSALAPSKSMRPKSREEGKAQLKLDSISRSGDGYKKGGRVKKMKSGGMCRGGGAATRGKKFSGEY